MVRRMGIFTAYVLLPLAAGQAQDTSNPALFRSEANLVVCDVQVIHGSKPVPALLSGDFLITEDGRPRAIEFCEYSEAPLDIVLAIDISQGISRTSSPEWYPSLRRALSTIRKGDRVGVLSFGVQTEVHTSLTADAGVWREAVQEAVQRRRQRPSTPAIYDAVQKANELFSGEGGQPRRRSLLLITHNMGTAAPTPRDAAEHACLRTGATVHVIVVPTYAKDAGKRWGFGSVLTGPGQQAADPSVVISERQKPFPSTRVVIADQQTADALAEATGGEVFRTDMTDSGSAIVFAMDRLRDRYLIGFHVPTEEYTEGIHPFRVELAPAIKSRYSRYAAKNVARLLCSSKAVNFLTAL